MNLSCPFLHLGRAVFFAIPIAASAPDGLAQSFRSVKAKNHGCRYRMHLSE